MIDKTKRVFKSQYRRYLYRISKKVNKNWFERVRFKSATGRTLNYKNPIYFNDKLFWLNRYWQHPLKIKCADKLLMHAYLKEKELTHLSNKIYGIWNNGNEIDFNKLPDSFVLKCNHGCGFNIICRNKKTFDIDYASSLLNKWLKVDFGKLHNEYHYSFINPVIIAEKYLADIDSEDIIDYKLQCINGEPFCFLVCRNRSKGKVDLSTYSLGWERLAYLHNEDAVTIEKPKCLDKILQYSEILAKDFPYVRLDYYIINETPLLGEFTFTPYGNTVNYYKEDILLKMGQLLKLPNPYKPNKEK